MRATQNVIGLRGKLASEHGVEVSVFSPSGKELWLSCIHGHCAKGRVSSSDRLFRESAG